MDRQSFVLDSPNANDEAHRVTRALITGASGFVGQHLVAHLQSCGDETIASDLDQRGPDITDYRAVDELIGDTKPDVVYHLAGWSDVSGSWRNRAATYQANVIGTDSVLSACANHHTHRVLVISSADVYGNVPAHDQPIAETEPPRPAGPYAASKAAAEMVARQAHINGLGVIMARSFNHAGPGQRPDFVIPALARRVLHAKQQKATSLQTGVLTAERDFTDVRDVARAYRLLTEHGTPGEVYNVCRGTAVTIEAVLQELLTLADVDLTPVLDPQLVRPIEINRSCGDPTKLRSATGWSPTISLTQTLRDVLEECATQPEE